MSHVRVLREPPAIAVDGAAAPIRVVIVENHQLVSESLGLLLDSQEDMEVVGRASSMSDAAALPRGLNPDVVVMDFHLDDATGHDAWWPCAIPFPHQVCVPGP